MFPPSVSQGPAVASWPTLPSGAPFRGEDPEEAVSPAREEVTPNRFISDVKASRFTPCLQGQAQPDNASPEKHHGLWPASITGSTVRRRICVYINRCAPEQLAKESNVLAGAIRP